MTLHWSTSRRSRISSTTDAHSGIPLANLDFGQSVWPSPHLYAPILLATTKTMQMRRTIDVPVDGDQPDPQTLSHLVVKPHDVAHTSKSQEYDERIARRAPQIRKTDIQWYVSRGMGRSCQLHHRSQSARAKVLCDGLRRRMNRRFCQARYVHRRRNELVRDNGKVEQRRVPTALGSGTSRVV